MIWRGLVIAAVLAVMPPDGQAQAVEEPFEMLTTADLLEACTTSDPQHEREVSFCLGYVSAALHYDYAVAEAKYMERIACPPADTELVDAAKVFVTWAEAHPEHGGEIPVEGVMRAAEEAWPCEQ